MTDTKGSAAIAHGGDARNRGKRVARSKRCTMLRDEMRKARAATARAVRKLDAIVSTPHANLRQLGAVAEAVALAAGRLSGFSRLLAASSRKA